MEKVCPKCGGRMSASSMPISESVTLPIPFSPRISIRQYLPEKIFEHRTVAIFICDSCGYVEIYLNKLG